MLHSALVLTVAQQSLQTVLAKLAEDARLRVGNFQQGFLPVVSSASDLHEARSIFEALENLGGVCNVQLVSWLHEDCAENEAVEDEAAENDGTETEAEAVTGPAGERATAPGGWA